MKKLCRSISNDPFRAILIVVFVITFLAFAVALFAPIHTAFRYNGLDCTIDETETEIIIRCRKPQDNEQQTGIILTLYPPNIIPYNLNCI